MSRVLWILVIGALCACASREEPGQAREWGYQEGAAPAPAAPPPPVQSLQPQGIPIGTTKAPKPPWKSEPVRALDLDAGARGEVRAAQERSTYSREGMAAAARARRERERHGKRDRRRALASVDRLMARAEEARRLARAEAALGRTPRHAERRRAAYRAAIAAAAGKSHSACAHEAARLSERVRQRLQACQELRHEQSEAVERVERVTRATLASGVPLAGTRTDLRHALQRLEEITLLCDEAAAEELYARRVAEDYLGPVDLSGAPE